MGDAFLLVLHSAKVLPSSKIRGHNSQKLQAMADIEFRNRVTKKI